MTTFAKRVKAVLVSPGDATVKVIAKKDGTVQYRRSYYYRPGDLAAWGARVQEKLEAAGLAVTLELRDRWREWPKDSYYQATITEKREG